MAKKSLTVIFAILPPDGPGISVRIAYDPDIHDGILGYEVAAAVKKAVAKIRKKKKSAEEPAPA